MRSDTERNMKIIDNFLSKGYVSIKELSHYAEISTKTARKYLESIINNDYLGSKFWPKDLGEKYDEEIVEIQTRRSNEKYFRYKSSTFLTAPSNLTLLLSSLSKIN